MGNNGKLYEATTVIDLSVLDSILSFEFYLELQNNTNIIQIVNLKNHNIQYFTASLK